MQSDGSAKTEKKVSINSKDVTDIQPVLYSFRAVGGGFGSGSVMTAIRPPYWLYHDHALGVIWSLFNKDKNYIGITQLHWCLRFLLDLKSSQGEYTGDVDICIHLIQDDLIEQYAKLGEAMKSSPEQTTLEQTALEQTALEQTALEQTTLKQTTLEQSRKDSLQPIHSPLREEGAGSTDALPDEHVSTTAPEENPVASSTVRNSVDLTADQPPENGQVFPRMEQRASRMSSTTPEKNAESRKSGEKREARNSLEDCDHTKCGTSEPGDTKKKIAVSFVYNEMLSKGPAPCKDGESIADLLEKSGYFDASHDKTSDHQKHGDHTDVATSKEMVNFLNSSRQQHIERIKKEIERLHGLEKFMENLMNASDFSAYVTEDLAKRMESLQNEDVVREAGEITRGN